MVDPTDWRLQGQERYLAGITLSRARWKVTREHWDHDHCEFCWKKIWDRAHGDDEATVGWTSHDEYRWICDQCFADFKESFGWRVTEHPDPDRRS